MIPVPACPLCGWQCLAEFARQPDAGKAADAAHGALHRAWVRGNARWYVHPTAGGAVLREVREFLSGFRSLSDAVAAAETRSGGNASEIPTASR